MAKGPKPRWYREYYQTPEGSRKYRIKWGTPLAERNGNNTVPEQSLHQKVGRQGPVRWIDQVIQGEEKREQERDTQIRAGRPENK